MGELPHSLDDGNIYEKRIHLLLLIRFFLRDNAKGNTAITWITTGYILLYDIYEVLCKEDEVKTDRRKINRKI